MSKSANRSTSTRNKHSEGSTDYDKLSIDITKDELDRIGEAFKKDEFRKMFLDYIDEIQDPENRKLYESEIKQFEAERGVEVKFVNPEPGFVIKTSVNGTMKTFVNVAKSPEIAKPISSIETNPENGKRGLSWSIPMAQAAPRNDVDAKGKRCCVYDVIFHPDSLHLAERNGEFRKCLIETSLDAVEREYKVKLDRNNLKFPKLEFKGVSRPTVIRKLMKNAPAETMETDPFDKILPPKPTSTSPQFKVVTTTNTSAGKDEYTTPKYVIKHKRNVDLTEYTDELDAKLNVTIPKELIVEIKMPMLKSSTECQLDVTGKSLSLLSDRVGAKYRLDVQLPYTVNDKDGSARFDIDTRVLSVTLPVIQQNATEQRNMHNILLNLNREDSGVESDIREESNSNNSESPVQELDDTIHETAADAEGKDEETLQEDSTSAILTPETFLKSAVNYQFPAKFDCNALDNVLSLVLHVRNVQGDSILMLQHSKNVHLQFCSIGSGYYPVYYGFYFQLDDNCDIEVESAEAEAWENNVVLNINLTNSSENISNYLAGFDKESLKEYFIQEIYHIPKNTNSRPSNQIISPTPISLSSSLDVSIERSECERSVEIEIKPREQQSTCGANTTEDEEHGLPVDGQQISKKLNKKQRKKNKKQRSLSESACDEIKAYQQQEEKQKKQQKIFKQKQQKNQQKSKANHEDIDCNDDSSPERIEPVPIKQITSPSMAVPTTSSQKEKQRNYFESRTVGGVSGSAGSNSTAPPSYKSILKRYSRYEPRRSVSDSCSSIDDYSSSYSCSVDTGIASSMRFSQSFSDIPEENPSGEFCKKTVRFNEVIKKQLFRLDSSILRQRKKNQKSKNRKQRALRRRLSEGDSADYEENNKTVEVNPQQYFKSKTNYKNQLNQIENNWLNKKVNENIVFNTSSSENGINIVQKNNRRLRLESESSDMENTKNSMMFEMDM